ncbi:multidrug/protein/lipid ABC exporter, ATP-binding/permease protein MsbA [Mycoplasmopsis canis PG 14]|uniref:ABC-type multidrug/protein/lipid transport system ATPase component n=1 Tax=Mycoplasmopsis canis TaxID=29555 RepID=A0A449ARC0_9BACT|nr:ABC transporter ATP-binding protein [Mycoplasmopsis canis]AMD81494.1 ABC transporter ATP-binding protein [Mycoplasmopsis canis PG 14]EIE39487.1 multidrug/protein/lipid ABC exporter, ATP-binding/permease protein MsbA [Mycoplasmopsis canis PG 14]VEU69124.1 ABC-type multidrug/protein/lipid transport system ATPase component [Mycoplasmopsis canis]
MKKTDKVSSWQAIKLLFSFAKDFKSTIIWGTIFSLINAVAYIAGSFLIGAIVSIFFQPIAENQQRFEDFDMTKFIIFLSSLAGCYIIYGIFRYLETRFFVKVSFGAAANIRKKLISKMLKLNIGFYDKNKAGDLISTIIVDVTNIAFSLNQVFSAVVNAAINIFLAVIIMFLVSAKLTLIVIPLTLIMFSGVILLIKKSQPHFVQVRNAFGKLNSFVEETLSNTKITNSFEKQKPLLNQLQSITKEIRDTAFKSDLISRSFETIYNVMSNSIILIITGIATLFFFNKEPIWGIPGIIGDSTSIATPGLIVTYISLNWNFLGPFQNALGTIFGAQTGVASTTRVAKLLEEKEPIIKNQKIKIVKVAFNEETNEFIETNNEDLFGFYTWKFFNNETNKYELKSVKGTVEFENVYFKYLEESEKYQLNNASFKAERGQKIAIVGPTGAGKTTIINLLSKYYDYNKGSIKIDGFELNEIDTNNLRDIMTIVLQDSFLFNETIIDNLKVSNPNATEEEIIKAAKMTKAHDFILGMENGYRTLIENNGANISQGQRQLLSLTRAILSNRNILILDEATSNIDSSTEMFVQESMLHLMEYKTSFIIAHRLSTIKNADVIIVIDNGEIIEQGNHQSLIDQKGFYYNLYQSQFEGNKD